MTVTTLFPTEFQLHLFHEGTLFDAHELFGAHLVEAEGITHTRFCVWAPNARIIRLVGDFNNWNGMGYDLHKVNHEGVWMLVVNQDLSHENYKYEIITSTNERLLKADPFGYYSELRPHTASVVFPLSGYDWNDEEWLKKRRKKDTKNEATLIYEVHLGSWKLKDDGSYYTYRELADELIPYVGELGFTHIEIMPIVEHPLDLSWGYQGTGYFSVTSRYGNPVNFMYFVDQCHQNGIGVILDWVPGHFCKDAHGLYRFDGSYLYEYQNSLDRENEIWGTANFDLGKTEVQSFLISNAKFWIEYFHVDGFRVDAVSNLIYWPNSNGMHENQFAIRFLKKLHTFINEYDSSVLMIAEDSTDWPGVTKSAEDNGLGFTYKWNMGWMNDTLDYMETPPDQRANKHHKITFSMLYAFSESFVLPFSHDEVVHGKKSLLNKMPGDYWDKFAQYRLLLGYMICHPGKKLLFMGFELGHFAEWKDQEQLDWFLLDYDMHDKTHAYVKELFKVYRRSKPLYELDCSYEGFEWIDVHNKEQSIFSFIRKGKRANELLVVICNFTSHMYPEFRVGVPLLGSYREILNSDDSRFGGSHVINKKVIKAEEQEFHGKAYSISMSMPPYGISILRPVKHRKERISNGKEKMRSDAISRRERE
jgi:1,4-alpha-glucan branching enzyme